MSDLERLKNIKDYYRIHGDGIARIDIRKAITSSTFRRNVRKVASIPGNFNVDDTRIAVVSALHTKEAE